MSIEAMKLALDALFGPWDGCVNSIEGRAITALRQAIEQAEQAQPVACPYCHNSHTLGAVYFDQNCAGCVKRMTAPPPRQPLTDEEIDRMYVSCKYGSVRELARAIEAAHGIKENT
jgi:nucleoside-diphosphate-sugar epimerase